MRKVLVLAVILVLLVPSIALAQGDDSGSGLCGGIMIFGGLALNVALLLWVAQDARKRGASGCGWLIVVFLFGLLGWLVYLIARPQGNLAACAFCGQMKPIPMAVCPHCGRRVV
ncbi:MAG: PLDc N-terminal domain-containing protein [Sphaerochaeta sp.]|jgi:hypothetical protein|nr:PLDc N-terminal domain-containing protein [Sphaerochaeta sp.]